MFLHPIVLIDTRYAVLDIAYKAGSMAVVVVETLTFSILWFY
jgi:hypothetical protein